MPLYIRDDEVAAMADELARLTQARNKTEAVRQALSHELDRARERVPLRERLHRIHAKAGALGLPNPDFDMKAYTDEMWDER